MIDGLAKALEVALDPAGHDIDVQAAPADPVEGRGHLREQARRYKAGPDGNQEPDAARDRREGGGRGPGLGEGRALVEEPIGEPRGDEHGVKPAGLGRLHDVAQVLE